ncbi:MAG TPA: Gfo/Idh/MocA family oxidoreductase [Roseiflexaceae bacterium]|nr:Gfo/Idh/MocA family oxidoreductase [Roseiflexaceae bacterium]HMP42840.1 Gfo/Idh/MocA family oxidoreductase [Roseiflexaceae bacterium]
MNQPVRIGIVGCGSVMQDGYMPIVRDLQASGLAECRMACDAAADRRAVAEGCGIPAFTTDYQHLINAADIDLVLVLTPPAFHYPIAAAALAAGKHVLVEKPMALAIADAGRLVQQAARSQGWLLAAPHIILSPTYRAIGRRLRRGEIGTVFSARGLCGHAGPDWGAWYYQAGGGGPLCCVRRGRPPYGNR